MRDWARRLLYVARLPQCIQIKFNRCAEVGLAEVHSVAVGDDSGSRFGKGQGRKFVAGSVSVKNQLPKQKNQKTKNNENTY